MLGQYAGGRPEALPTEQAVKSTACACGPGSVVNCGQRVPPEQKPDYIIVAIEVKSNLKVNTVKPHQANLACLKTFHGLVR